MKNLTILRTIALVAGLMLFAYSGWGQYTGSGTFQQITTLEQLEPGGYYVFYGIDGSHPGRAMNNTFSGGRMGGSEITITDNQIVDPPVSIVWLVEGNSEDGFTIYNEAAEKYCEITSANNTSAFAFVTDPNFAFNVTVIADNFVFRTNASPSTRCIALFQSSNFRSYANPNTLHLYKLTEVSEDQVALPMFTPGTGNYYEAFEVSMATSTSDAVIYFSFDSNDPAEGTWTEYDEEDKPIISESTTIWAYATKEGMDPSNVSSASYTFPIDVENIAELRTKVGDGKIYRLTGGAVITLQGEQSRNQRFIQDDDAGILIDDNNGILGEYEIGDVLENLIGTVTEFNNMLQLIPSVDLASIVESDVFPEPIPVSIPDIDGALQGMLIKVVNLTYQGSSSNFAANQNYDFNDGDDNSITLRTIFSDLDYIGGPIPLLPQDIVGTHGIFGTTLQITPRSWDDFTEVEVEDPLLVVSTSLLSGFTYMFGHGPSDNQSFTVNGLNLVDDITVTAPDNFEIFVTSKTDFTDEITLPQIDGIVVDREILVRLVQGLGVGIYTGTLTVETDGAEASEVSLSGEVTEPFATEVPFTTDFGVAENWTDLPPTGWTGYNPKAYEDGGWYFHSTAAVRGTLAYELFEDSDYAFRDRGVFTVHNLASASGMTGFSFQLFDWMTGSGVDRDLNISLDGGESWLTVLTINKAWFDEYQTYQEFVYYFESPQDFAAEEFMIQILNPNTGNNVSRINIGQFKALDDEPPPPPVAAPVIDPPGDDYPGAVLVTITTETDGAAIFYRLSPEDEWTEYTDEFSINETTTVQAYATKDGMTDSEINSATYNILDPAFTALPYLETFDEDLGECYVYSVSGDTKFWEWNSGGWAQMNGFNSGDVEEDWLILPGFNPDNYYCAVMTFDTWMRFGEDNEDNYLKLLYSTDYIGVGNPGSAEWTELSYTQPDVWQEWTNSGIIDLSHISGNSVYLAFKYRYEPGKYRLWQIDNITILPASTYAFDFETPEEVCPNTTVVVPVTFANVDPPGGCGYDAVIFEFWADGPGSVTFGATDTNDQYHTFVDQGNWGPASGFPLSPEYAATTNWDMTFSEPGIYTITFRLLDVSLPTHSEVITQDVAEVLVYGCELCLEFETWTIGEDPGDEIIVIDISGTFACEEYSQVTVLGLLDLTGAQLIVNLGNDYLPEAGEQFEIFTYGTRKGKFDNLDLFKSTCGKVTFIISYEDDDTKNDENKIILTVVKSAFETIFQGPDAPFDMPE